MTKETVAEFLNLELILDSASLKTIRCFFSRRGRHMTDNNIKQALLPKGGIALPNPNGYCAWRMARIQGQDSSHPSRPAF